MFYKNKSTLWAKLQLSGKGVLPLKHSSKYNRKPIDDVTVDEYKLMDIFNRMDKPIDLKCPFQLFSEGWESDKSIINGYDELLSIVIKTFSIMGDCNIILTSKNGVSIINYDTELDIVTSLRKHQ